MRLSVDPLFLQDLPIDILIEAIKERRRTIRYHRDQKGDDRCWLDDWLLWSLLSSTSVEPREITFAEGMTQCQVFYNFRRSDNVPPDQDQSVTCLQDIDIDRLVIARNQKALAIILIELQEAIRRHRDIFGRPRTWKDDQALYDMLPEKIQADFRLPSREAFLGEERAPHAGCPAFWRSHTNCSKLHNYHQWGPCNSRK